MRKDWKESVEDRALHPESLMMGFGYKPAWSEGALKSPIFQTSTFVFESAEQGKHFFELATGQCEYAPGEHIGMIYSRLNNPDLEILEDRLTLWDDAESALVFSSGMAAIATTLLAYLKPGRVLLHSAPLYGGTDHLVKHTLPDLGIQTVEYMAGMGREDIEALLADEAPNAQLGLIFIETPANPTNDLFDIRVAADIAAAHATDDFRPLVASTTRSSGPCGSTPSSTAPTSSSTRRPSTSAATATSSPAPSSGRSRRWRRLPGSAPTWATWRPRTRAGC